MLVELTRVAERRHRMRIRRDDGSAEERELETRSLLLHDLVHYAVEAEGPFERGVYGLLARGVTWAELDDRQRATPLSDEIELVERLVGPLQAVVQGRIEAERFVEQARALGSERVDMSFTRRVQQRVRALRGAWRATPFGGTLELSWPPSTPPRVRT